MNNSSENINQYTVIIGIDAQEFFEASSASLQKKLDRCFERLKIEPRNYPNIKPLKGELLGYYRYRVSDYRVIYKIDDNIKQVTIILIEHRSRVYE
ncbi:type II toxin-antitoxin system RelE/ParE family toxin [Cronbergia sp. UHCC 0137]|uniref:type II toxin-antitoxin system RelE family toxin n=1 Tax=Cronbergia sp. UHCC 0137 TaxID=3110239 RepID=UPI002B1FA0AC|nr:type II toxin-antitoxin system RelE/ParE family toxin [Cronbergia sp. UHCC 0137]MEA5619763.1 type II toxin-antitoxin system RelE/ParE family toxin [Cronbergia sp. UHCC 0137]